ncbi:MAG: hypothetical protein Q7J77_10540 [Undibacterium sp.]|nr:hypothetical protein [Undibacterium sp.]
MRTCLIHPLSLLCVFILNGCTVLAVADAVVSTTVKVGSAVVGTAIDVTRAGVHAVTSSDSDTDKSGDKNNGKK